MTSPKPHYLLFCDGNVSANGESAGLQRGRWRFVLEDLVSGVRVEATDQENACAPDRSALVAVLRGLEALEQPSRVTLVTTSRYVTRGLQYGLSEWRENDYSWEHFGAVQPIRNADIWKRIDRALAYHQVQCRWMAQEAATEPLDDSFSASQAPRPSEKQAGQAAQAANPSKLASVEAGKSTNLQNTSRRSRTVGSTQTTASTTKHQRVYVDTPLSSVSLPAPISPSISIENRVALLLEKEIPTMDFDGSNQNKTKFRKSHPVFFQCDFLRLHSFLHLLMRPVRLARRGPVCLCNHVWDAILAIDEWLESFLRCLFLLDPSKRASRRLLEDACRQPSLTRKPYHSV